MLLVTAAILIVVALIVSPDTHDHTSLGILFFFFVFIPFVLFVVLFHWRRTLRGFHEQLQLGDREIVVKFTEKGFNTTLDLASFELDWQQIVKWDMSSECLYLYYTDWTPQLVPRRALSPIECELAMAQLNDVPRANFPHR